MSKTLVAYFSASGVTEKLAKTLAEAIHADLFQIQPEIPYTDEDLNWNNPRSRSSVEMNDKSFRPPVAGQVEHMEQYDRIFVGFPIWWYVAPTILNTFLEAYDFTGKTIVLFTPPEATVRASQPPGCVPAPPAPRLWMAGCSMAA